MQDLTYSTLEAAQLSDCYCIDNFIIRSELNREDLRQYPELIQLIRAKINLQRLIKNRNYEKREGFKK